MLARIRERIGQSSVGKKLLLTYRKLKFRYWYNWFSDKETLFTEYYNRNVWGDPESRSGHGSTEQYTRNLRRELPQLFQKYHVKTLLDAPCGDFNWFKLVRGDLELTYIGADIVEAVVQNNQAEYADETTYFRHINIIKDEIPEADLWMCRDCLIHFSTKDIYRTFKNLLKADITYLLTTSYPDNQLNADIETGEHRFLNLCAPPFNFPEPEIWINDGKEEHLEKKMGLWKMETIHPIVETFIQHYG